MATDLNYAATLGSNNRLQLTGSQNTPEVLKDAITLMLFNDDPDIRNFDGSSIIHIFPTLPESGFDGIRFYLAVAAARIKQLLRQRHANISDVYFENVSNGGTLSVTLNVVVNNNKESVVVW